MEQESKTFEQSMARLDAIVRQMEQGNVPLEESLKREEKRLRDYEKEAREAMIGMKSGAYAFCLYYYICGMNLEDTARITDRCERQIRRYKREIEKEEKAEE